MNKGSLVADPATAFTVEVTRKDAAVSRQALADWGGQWANWEVHGESPSPLQRTHTHTYRMHCLNCPGVILII